MKYTGVILAGGKSRRMGKDKGTLLLGNQTIVEHVIETLNQVVNNLILITDKPENYRRFGIPIFGDILQANGALVGIYTGLVMSQTSHSLFVACDMPFVKKKLLQYMISKLEQSQSIAISTASDLERIRKLEDKEVNRQKVKRQEGKTAKRQDGKMVKRQDDRMANSPSNHLANHQSPVTNHQSPVTSHQSPVTNHQSPIDIIVPKSRQGFEPLCAVYSKRCIPEIKSMIDKNIMKIVLLFEKFRTCIISEDKISALDSEGSFFNVNSKEDYEKALELIKKGEGYAS